MKAIIGLCSTTLLLQAAAFDAAADVVAGPITNPANGHDYYLLAPNSWGASELEAEYLGGTLAIIRNAGEQEWVFSTFDSYGGTNHTLWIGLHRSRPGGPFGWVTEDKLDYLNWAPGEPNNAGGMETAVHMCRPQGAWNDTPDDNPFNGVVEVPGKSQERSLSEQERSLVGTWYESGKREYPCWIVTTDNQLFAINHARNASRAICTTEGSLFFSSWKMRAEVIQDRMLWSCGTWWSRKPVEYKSESSKAGEKPSGKAGEKHPTELKSPRAAAE